MGHCQRGEVWGFVPASSCFPGNPDTSTLTQELCLSPGQCSTGIPQAPQGQDAGLWQDMGLWKEREWQRWSQQVTGPDADAGCEGVLVWLLE